MKSDRVQIDKKPHANVYYVTVDGKRVGASSSRKAAEDFAARAIETLDKPNV